MGGLFLCNLVVQCRPQRALKCNKKISFIWGVKGQYFFLSSQIGEENLVQQRWKIFGWREFHTQVNEALENLAQNPLFLIVLGSK